MILLYIYLTGLVLGLLFTVLFAFSEYGHGYAPWTILGMAITWPWWFILFGYRIIYGLITGRNTQGEEP